MKREYFCCGCGLLYWRALHSLDDCCPSPTCKSHEDDVYPFRYACDSIAWFYFSEKNHAIIRKMQWSSLLYAPQTALDYYQEQGVLIK